MSTTYLRPKWRPECPESSGWIVERMAHYTNHTKSFLVYKYGTAVFADDIKCSDVDGCNAAVLDVVSHTPNFTVRPMRDGNFLVHFRGPVYSVVRGEWFEANRQQLTTAALSCGLLPGESVIPPSTKVVEAGHHVIGLYARANMYGDAESLIVVEKFVST